MSKLTKAQRDVERCMPGWRADPIRFMVEALDVDPAHVWDKMREVADSFKDNERTAVAAGHGVSKALSVDTPIMTPHGFVPICDLSVGDYVFDEAGQQTKVAEISPVQTLKSYRIVFDDNSEVFAHGEHQWNVHDFLARKRLLRSGVRDYRNAWSKTKTVTTDWMSENLLYNRQHNVSIPLCMPLAGEGSISFPYTLGFWLGDGTRNTSYVTIGDKDASEIIKYIEGEGFDVVEVPSQRQENCGCYCIRGLRPKLRELGILKDKRIPTDMLLASSDCRASVLQGYMDADGYRLHHGRSAALGTTDKPLYDSAVSLISGLGYKVYTGVEVREYKGNPLIVYKLNFSPDNQPFRLQRKLIEVSARQRSRRTMRIVKSVGCVGSIPVACISVESSRSLYLCGPTYIPTHNTYTAARLVLWFLYCHCPSTVITTAPTHKQVEELLWREVREAHANARIPLGGKPTRTRLDLQDQTGKRWYALGFSTKADTVTQEATAMQGYHNDNIALIFDEAAGIMPQIWKAGQHLLTSGHTRWLVIGNPTAPTGNFAECITTDRVWHKINISVKDTPNYKHDREVVPGLSGRRYESEIHQKYGANSNEYKVRILGQMPDFGEGTYFGREMGEAVLGGQVDFYPHEKHAKVYTIWDIGHMHTVILFVQLVRSSVRVIDFFYDSQGLGLPAHAQILQHKATDKGYVYAQHIAPWDIKGSNAKSFQTGKYTLDIAKSLGIDFHVLPKYGLDDQLAAARDLIRLCVFHKPATKEMVRALSTFRRKQNALLSTTDKPVYYEQPVKDWTEHVASAFMGLAMAYRYEIRVDNMLVGYPNPVPVHVGLGRDTDKKYDPLRHGLGAA